MFQTGFSGCLSTYKTRNVISAQIFLQDCCFTAAQMGRAAGERPGSPAPVAAAPAPAPQTCLSQSQQMRHYGIQTPQILPTILSVVALAAGTAAVPFICTLLERVLTGIENSPTEHRHVRAAHQRFL